MNKPTKTTKSFYDYRDCRDYLEEKYGYKERDYAGKYKYHNECVKKTNEKFGDNGWYTTNHVSMNADQKLASDFYNELKKSEPKYLDFWHWVVKAYEIHNGCYITFSKETLDEGYEMEDWVKTIYGYYLTEFADEDGELEMWVWW